MTSVLHVITGLGPGGAETMLAQLATALQKRGAPQHVVALKYRGPNADILEAGGVPVSVLGVTSVLKAPFGIVSLVGLIRRVRPKILQGWMYHGNLAAALAHRLTPGCARRKLLWNLRASNMDAERYGWLVGWNARLSSWPEIVIANSQTGMDFHLQRSFRPRRRQMIPNGIDTEKFAPDSAARSAVRKELGIADDAVLAISAARVDPMKDHATLLAAMASVPNVWGLLVGTDTAALMLPGNVIALGLRHDLPRLYAAADIVVSSSAFGEGFSNALGEGMSAGLVPVATDVGDARDIVGDTGRIVPPRDRDALAGAIAAEASESAGERRNRGLRARQRIVENFTIERAVDAFAKLYDELGRQP